MFLWQKTKVLTKEYNVELIRYNTQEKAPIYGNFPGHTSARTKTAHKMKTKQNKKPVAKM